ncbi:MAG: transposase [Solirubrobacteraceae bacterium]|jgi:transposase|nr:transposase [Solirubrobacteraceae bacterium]
MAQIRSWAGLDVHARSVLAVTVDGVSGETRMRRLPGNTSEVVQFCATLPGPTRVAYEAGPTGYGLARALRATGIDCVVAAPGKIERPAQDRVKTDKRDAERVLRLLMIDGLHPVRVPSNEEEALRDLVRAREDLRCDLMRARQRLSKLLLRHDVRYEDTASAWTARHRDWLTRVDLGAGAQITLLDYLGAIDALVIRRNTLEATIAELVPGSPWAQTVARLRCLRGIDTLSAVGLCAEVGDFARFDRAARLMSYLGLVPSEDTSGEKRRQGAITKTGSRHARRLLVEAAWHYRKPPARGQALKRRQDGQPAHVLAISWQAQQRLHRVWRRLDHDRGKRRTIVAVAVARELAGFCWALATAD